MVRAHHLAEKHDDQGGQWVHGEAILTRGLPGFESGRGERLRSGDCAVEQFSHLGRLNNHTQLGRYVSVCSR